MLTHLLLLRLWTLLILSTIFIQPVSAQLMDDVVRNLVIDDRQDEQVLPLIVSNSDGGCYVSWFDHSSGSYQLCVQKLDEKGNKLWGENGLLVSSNQQDTWLTGYDMISDRDGNVIITFADTRQGIQNIFAYKISPNKEFVWGNDGVMLSESEFFEHSPRLVETSDGNYMFAWEVIYDSESSGVLVQKLTTEGEKVFSNGNLTLTSYMPKNCYSRLVPSDNGSAIISFMSYDSDTLVKEDDMVLTVQKISAAGHVLFPVDNPLKLGIELQNCGGIVYFIRHTMISDGNNGAYIAWYDDRTKSNIYTTYLQHIDNQGNIAYKTNGVQASNLFGNEMLYPMIACNPQTTEPLLFWINNDKSVNNEGISLKCQKFNLIGKPVFGESGKKLLSWLPGYDVTGYYIVPSTNGVYVLFLHNESGTDICPPQNKLKCMFINYNGEQMWSSNIVTMSESSPKYALHATTRCGESCIAVWCDQKNDQGGIYAQNINSDGTLDYKPTGVDDGESDRFDFEIYPNPINTSAVFSYNLQNDGFVSLRIYDLLGNEIKSLVNEYQFNGRKSIHWNGFSSDGKKVNAGFYFYKLKAGNETLFGKFIVQ